MLVCWVQQKLTTFIMPTKSARQEAKDQYWGTSMKRQHLKRLLKNYYALH